jgi:hypothetical protein
VLIAVSSGSAAVLALLLGAAIYIVRSRVAHGTGREGEPETGQETNRHSRRESEYSRPGDGDTDPAHRTEDVGSEMLSTMTSTDDGEEAGLWI